MKYAFILAAIVVLAGCSTPQTEYERYTEICRDRGGFVSEHKSWTSSHYSCVGQTDGPTLPIVSR